MGSTTGSDGSIDTKDSLNAPSTKPPVFDRSAALIFLSLQKTGTQRTTYLAGA